MRSALLALAICACTEVTKTTAPAPPAPEEILGAYSVSWSDGALLGAGVIAGGSIIGLAPYPCATTEEVRGTYEYDAGLLTAELKPLEGSVKLLLSVRFSGPDSASGEYEALLLGERCAAGSVEMRRSE